MLSFFGKFSLVKSALRAKIQQIKEGGERKLLPKWTDDYSIGNPVLDDQHKRLFEIANELEGIIDRPVSKSKIKEMLAELLNYTKNHFHDEEVYMREIKFPEHELHRRIHQEAINDMVALVASVKTTNHLKEALYQVCKKWILEHILFEDMKIAEFIRYQHALEGEAKKEISYIEADLETHGYYYTCGCEGKMHDVPEEVHHQILMDTKEVRCRLCNERIVFLEKADDVE